VIAREPPLATGHGSQWAEIANTSPNDAVSQLSRDCTEWAAHPANSARAGTSSKKASHSCRADHTALSPNRAIAKGASGGKRSGPRMSRNSAG